LGYFWGYIFGPIQDHGKRQMNLSDVQIKNLRPKARAFEAYDSHGLFVSVTPTGSKLWRLKYRIDGREKLISLGQYPLVSLKEARERALEARKL